MKTALELAARALCSLDGHPEDATMDGKPLWMDYLREARAVFVAIRTPTEAMGKAGEALLGDERMHSVSSSDLLDAWRVMVDAALAEQP